MIDFELKPNRDYEARDVSTYTLLHPFDSETHSRKGMGILVLYLDMLHFKAIQNTTSQTDMKLFETVKFEIHEVVRDLVFQGEIKSIRTAEMINHLGYYRFGMTEERLEVPYALVSRQIQVIINQYAV
jgi:hypothetical protein